MDPSRQVGSFGVTRGQLVNLFEDKIEINNSGVSKLS